MDEARKERFYKFFRWTGLTSNGLAVKLGMNSRTIYNYTNKGLAPTDTCIRQCLKTFPQISDEWFFDGIGDMFVDGGSFVEDSSTPKLENRQPEKTSKATELYERLISTLESKCESLERQLEIANNMIEALMNNK